jgi:hypothetical protein
VRWKVRVLRALTGADDHPPVTRARVAVPDDLLADMPEFGGATRESLRQFRVSDFLAAIRDNWPGSDGSTTLPMTRLCAEDVAAVRALPWAAAWLGGVAGLVRWKIRVLCRVSSAWTRPPRQGLLFDVPADLLAAAPALGGTHRESLRQLDLSSLLLHIRSNWQGGRRTCMTRLCPEDVASVRALPWAAAWLGEEAPPPRASRKRARGAA